MSSKLLSVVLCARLAQRKWVCCAPQKLLLQWLLPLVMLLSVGGPVRAEVELPRPDDHQVITFGADQAQSWNQGAYELWLLRGNCFVQQGHTQTKSDEAVLWVQRAGDFGDRQNLVITYLEGNVTIDYRRAGYPYQLADKSWLGEFFSTAPIEIRTPQPGPEPAVKPQAYHNAVNRRDPFGAQAIRRTQFSPGPALPPGSIGPGGVLVGPGGAAGSGAAAGPGALPAPGGMMSGPSGVIAAEPAPAVGRRRLRAYPRSDVKVQAQWFPSPDGREWIAVISSGVNLIIEGVEGVGTLDIATDRLVLWTQGADQPDLSGNNPQGENAPLEIYMEGNIVFREGARVIRASRMYYDVNNQVGTVLDAQMLTPVPNFNGLLRLKADVVRQTGPNSFLADEAYLTSSRMADPRYRLQSERITLNDNQRPLLDRFSGEPIIDPTTGQQQFIHERLAEGQNNFVYLGPVPVFYWPRFTADLENPSYYLRRAQVRNDQVFGTQALTDWDLYQLLGWRNRPVGTDWTATLDYLSLRGVGYGSNFTYNRQDVFGVPGAAIGFQDYWGIEDHGNDRLGEGRMAIPPGKDYRWRWLGRHRQTVLNDWRLTGEVGWISDQNFLEQYYEREWDEMKDLLTAIDLSRTSGNMSYGVYGAVRINEFFTQTNWMPRFDHFWLGQSLLDDRLTWYEHTSLGLTQLRPAAPPKDPAQAATTATLPWEVHASGERFATRHELDMPFELGATKIVPYALGEFAHWGEDISQESMQRFYYQVGVRGSVPFWSVNPEVQSRLWNLNGMAHKVVFDTEIFYADANQNLTDLPLYDPLQDDSQEAFERRFAYNTFGTGVIPTRFDDRFYAVRSGLGSWVTSPATEVVDDLAGWRLGSRQRWQTKRGRIDQQRIIDWITLDTNTVLYANSNEYNFGSTVGLTDYDFRWHVGDRLTVLSEGSFDFFSEGQKIVSLGVTLSRPPRGRWYAGLHSIAGPVSYNIASTYYSYRMSPKWFATAGAMYNLSGPSAIGNNLALTRVGESLITSFGFTYDRFKDNVGVNLMVEPRFLARQRLVNVPIAGMYGLE